MCTLEEVTRRSYSKNDHEKWCNIWKSRQTIGPRPSNCPPPRKKKICDWTQAVKFIVYITTIFTALCPFALQRRGLPVSSAMWWLQLINPRLLVTVTNPVGYTGCIFPIEFSEKSSYVYISLVAGFGVNHNPCESDSMHKCFQTG